MDLLKTRLFALFALSLLLFGCVSQPQAAAASPAPESRSTSPAIPGVSQSPSVSALVVENGDFVAVDYVGTLDDGTVFDTSLKEETVKANLSLRPSYEPLGFKVGAGEMISGFDKGVVGMKEGEEKTIRLAPSEAYGEPDDSLVVTYSIGNFPDGATVGAAVYAESGRPGKILSLNATHGTIDFNHALAGKALNFRIIVRKISKK